MDDAARTWVCPFCQRYPGPDPENPGVVVWVLNPGGPSAGDAKVTVRIYDSLTAALLGTQTMTVAPMKSQIFTPAQPENGWCHVQSDKPVFPWGLSGWQSGDQRGVTDMTFYRHEPIQIRLPGLPGVISSALETVSRGAKPRQGAIAETAQEQP